MAERYQVHKRDDGTWAVWDYAWLEIVEECLSKSAAQNLATSLNARGGERHADGDPGR